MQTGRIGRGVASACAVAGAFALALLVGRGVAESATPAESYVRSAPRAPGEPIPRLFRAPAFDLGEARGARVSRASLEGHVWIASFLFTRCTSVCPTLTARLVQLQRAMASSPGVRFVSISVDPEHDDADALRAYAQAWPADPRWLLLSASRDELDELARGLRVAVVRTGDTRDPIVHSRLLTLVDADGWVRGIYDSDDVQAWARIAADAEALDATTRTQRHDEITRADDAPLHALGCTGCHDRREVAPPLGGGDGRVVTLATGETVMADDAYLRESILRPGARMVAGYAPLMPSYAASLSSGELDALVVAIRALPAPAPMPTVSGGPAIDPVCHMHVSTTDAALTLHVGDHDEHFCSRSCLDTYRAAHP